MRSTAPTPRAGLGGGRTDTAIARDLAALAGVSGERFDAGLDEFRAVCAEAFAARCPPSLTEHLAPGIAELLDAVAERDGIELSLVTGNYEGIARLKLERAGIGHHFPAGPGRFRLGLRASRRAAADRARPRRQATRGSARS